MSNITDISPMVRRSQSGFVSIFSVLFFIIIATIITTGFLRIALRETQQAIDNSSANSALAAARAGIEDGKRALVLYNKTSDTTLKTAIQDAIATQNCTAIFGNSDIASALSLDTNGKVETQNLDQQYYTCLTIQPDTDTYETVVAPGKSTIIPLQAKTNFDSVTLRWHKLSTDGALTSGAEPLVGTNPNVADFASTGVPTFIRLQLIAVPNATTVTNISSATGFIRTNTKIAGAAPTNFMSYDSSGPKQAAGVTSCNTSVTEYACEVVLNAASFPGVIPPPAPPSPIFPINTAANTYLLRVSALYSNVHIQAIMKNGADTSKFSMVQPEIDSTGKSGDTFRRLKARVKFANDAYVPEYTAEAYGTGGQGKICKAFSVTSATMVQSDPTCLLP
ncbi:MAG: hypothetical protein WBB33_00425 [Candidatus Saccharimonadales bacterium]